MIFSYPEIDQRIDINEPLIHTLVIENKRLLLSLTEDIYAQIRGENGKAVLYDGTKLLDFAKSVDLTTSFVPFELNRKPLLNKIVSALENNALREHYEETLKLLAAFENYFDDIAFDFSCNLCYTKNNISALLKAVGVEIVDDSADVAEKMLDYMELVQEFDQDKLFITVNMRSFVEDDRAEAFTLSALAHGFKLLMIESTAYPLLQSEKRLTVDSDLCIF